MKHLPTIAILIILLTGCAHFFKTAPFHHTVKLTDLTVRFTDECPTPWGSADKDSNTICVETEMDADGKITPNKKVFEVTGHEAWHILHRADPEHIRHPHEN